LDFTPSAPTTRSARYFRGRGARDLGVEHELDVFPFRHVEDRRIECLAGHGQHAVVALGREFRAVDQLAPVAHLVDLRLVRSGDHVVVGVDRLQDPKPVLPDEDPGAEGAQRLALLVHAHRPAAARQCDRRDEAGEPAPGDLGMATLGHHVDASISRPR
jgi:hypothetical protein